MESPPNGKGALGRRAQSRTNKYRELGRSSHSWETFASHSELSRLLFSYQNFAHARVFFLPNRRLRAAALTGAGQSRKAPPIAGH